MLCSCACISHAGLSLPRNGVAAGQLRLMHLCLEALLLCCSARHVYSARQPNCSTKHNHKLLVYLQNKMSCCRQRAHRGSSKNEGSQQQVVAQLAYSRCNQTADPGKPQATGCKKSQTPRIEQVPVAMSKSASRCRTVLNVEDKLAWPSERVDSGDQARTHERKRDDGEFSRAHK